MRKNRSTTRLDSSKQAAGEGAGDPGAVSPAATEVTDVPGARRSVTEHQEAFDFGPPRPYVRAPHAGEHKTVLEVVGRAFFDDPVATYLFPDERGRVEKFAAMSGLAIDAFGDSALVLTNDAVQGAAIWQRPSPQRGGTWAQLRMGWRMFALTRRRFGRAMRLGEAMSTHHPKEPHYYLATLATDPVHQGRGIGSALMQPILERCDKERLPAYLESSKRENIPFYTRHGFEVTGEIEVPGGPRLWPMLRPSGQASTA